MGRRTPPDAEANVNSWIKLDPNVEHHPVVVKQREHRTQNIQLRVADRITVFAGSMMFVYIHAVLFVVWMLVFEKSPWPTLTLIVSLEAIFLSTFVMVGQNRQATFQQAKADHDYAAEEKLLQENTDLTRRIHELTQESTPASWAHRRRQQQRRPTRSPRADTTASPRIYGRRLTCILQVKRRPARAGGSEGGGEVRQRQHAQRVGEHAGVEAVLHECKRDAGSGVGPCDLAARAGVTERRG